MNKALVFQIIGMSLGGTMIMGNINNPTVMIFTAIIMICSYMVFQAYLPPMTNILSYWMASSNDKVKAVRKHDADEEKSEVKNEFE